MATGKTKREDLRMVGVSIPYSISAGGFFNTSLKTAIDPYIPSGYHYVGVAEWATNSPPVIIVNMFYDASVYSLYLYNIAGYAVSTNLGLGVLVARD